MIREIRIRLKSTELDFGAGKAGGIITRNHRAESQRANVAQSDIFAVGSTTSALLPPTALTGWLEAGCQKLLLDSGLSVCSAVSDEMVASITGGREKQAKDKEAGYHSRGECLGAKKGLKATGAELKEGCLIAETFGTLAKPGALLRSTFEVHALRGHAMEAIISGRGGYGMFRVTTTAPRSRESQEPYMPVELERMAFVDGMWSMQVRPWISDEMAAVIYGMLIKAVAFLNTNRTSYQSQMGGKRNFGAGIIECAIVNPLYDFSGDKGKDYARQIFKEAVGEEQEGDEGVLALKDEDIGKSKKATKETERRKSYLEEKDSEWSPKRDEFVAAFDAYMVASRERFVIENWKPKSA